MFSVDDLRNASCRSLPVRVGRLSIRGGMSFHSQVRRPLGSLEMEMEMEMGMETRRN